MSSPPPPSAAPNPRASRSPSPGPPEPPAPTLTEKVDDSVTGWEMWVADESLMAELSGRQQMPSLARPSSSEAPRPSRLPRPIPPWPLRVPSELGPAGSSSVKLSSLGTVTPIVERSRTTKQTSPSQSLSPLDKPFSSGTLPPPPAVSEQPTTTAEMSTTKLCSSLPPPDLLVSKNGLCDRSSSLVPSPGLARPTPDGGPYPYAHELYDRRALPRFPSNNTSPPLLTSHTPVPAPAPAPAPPAEICVECMMRDRDMADVVVTGPGVWARKSDADFEEALAAEAGIDERDELDSLQRGNGGGSAGGGPWASTSREGSGYDSTSSGAHRRKRLGHRNPLTQSALKSWTQMCPPAASHRWRTLQLYLKEQRHYLELEHKAKLTTQLENERAEHALRNSIETTKPEKAKLDYNFLNSAPGRGISKNLKRQSTILANGLVLETVDVSRDEKEAARALKSGEGKSRNSTSSRRVSGTSISRTAYASSPAVTTPTQRSPASLSGYTTNDLLYPGMQPHSPSVRAPSPSRFSVASRRSESMRPFSAWSKNRRSVSHSVLSLAPSGSMIDMHVGLSQDRHQQQERHLRPISTPAIAPELETKAKQSTIKKGLRSIFARLRVNSHSSRRKAAPSPTNLALSLVDDEPLAPPPSLSLLTREPHRTTSAYSLPLASPRDRQYFSPTSLPEDETLAEEFLLGNKRQSGNPTMSPVDLNGNTRPSWKPNHSVPPLAIHEEPYSIAPESHQQQNQPQSKRPSSIKSVVTRSLSLFGGTSGPQRSRSVLNNSTVEVDHDAGADFLPDKRSIKSISRSSDFLALRYLSSSSNKVGSVKQASNSDVRKSGL